MQYSKRYGTCKVPAISTYKSICRFALLLLLATIQHLKLEAQNELELSSASPSGTPIANPTGPTVAAQTATFLSNTTGSTFVANTPTLTATFTLSNQQYTSVPTSNVSTGTGISIGAGQSVNINTVPAQSYNAFVVMSGVGSPSNSSYTSSPLLAPGTGISVTDNYGLVLFCTTNPLGAANASTSGRFYFGDLTITFNRPVNNPVIHVVGLGGNVTFDNVSGTNGFSTELELQGSAATLSKLSGSAELNVTANKILNNATVPSVQCGSGAACGSILATGSGITTLTFKLFVRGDGNGTGWVTNTGSTCGDRWLLSVSMARPVNISGNVFDDNNGLTNNTVDGVQTTIPGGINANLVDGTGKVVQTVAIPTTGANAGKYSFTEVQSGTYTVQLSANAGVVGNTAPAIALPATWIATGENIGTAAGNDGTVDGKITVVSAGTDITNANFGIEQIPSGANYTAARQSNPGGTTRVAVPIAAFTGVDPEDGTYTTGLAGKTVTLTPGSNGNLYYNGTQVTGTQVIAGFDPTKVTIDPTGATPTTASAVTSSFTYSVNDAAGQPSAAATITMPFDVTTSLSGNVWDDANGDATKAGSELFTNAGGLNAVLTDASGNIIESVPVAAGGAFTFSKSVSSENYKIVLSTTSPAAGGSLTSSSLPAPANGNWVNTGVNPGGATPTTTNKTGILAVTMPASGAVTNRNFGIEQIPSGANYTAARQSNPGGTTRVAVPIAAFTGVDPEDGTYTTGLAGKTVTLTPGSNGNLYYNGTQVTGTQVIAGFDPTKVTIDPTGATPTTASAVTSSFTYSVNDAAGQPSAADTIMMPFDVAAGLSGNVWDDANGDATKAGAEPFTNAGGLNAVLTDASGNIIESVPVAAGGAFTFSKSVSSENYKIVLSTTNPVAGGSLTSSSLPAPANGNWVNTGVNPGGATPTTTNKTGILAVTMPASGAVTNRNFGMEQSPVTDAKSYATNDTSFSAIPPTGYPIIANYRSLLTSSVGLVGYGGLGGKLSGTDQEDCAATASCNTGKSFTIATINANTLLYYNFGAGAVAVSPNTSIPNYDPAKLAIYALTTSISTSAPIGFTYSLVDAAGVVSPAVTYTIVVSLFPLPLELISFNGAADNCNAAISWETAHEDAATSFNILRSSDGKSFQPVATIMAKGDNSTYETTVSNPTSAFFRLKINAAAGNADYSRTINIISNCRGSVISLSPNPTTATLKITGISGTATVTIFDMYGRKITQTGTPEDGILDVENLVPGTYTLQVTDKGEGVRYFKFIKQ